MERVGTQLSLLCKEVNKSIMPMVSDIWKYNKLKRRNQPPQQITTVPKRRGRPPKRPQTEVVLAPEQPERPEAMNIEVELEIPSRKASVDILQQ